MFPSDSSDVNRKYSSPDYKPKKNRPPLYERNNFEPLDLQNDYSEKMFRDKRKRDAIPQQRINDYSYYDRERIRNTENEEQSKYNGLKINYYDENMEPQKYIREDNKRNHNYRQNKYNGNQNNDKYESDYDENYYTKPNEKLKNERKTRYKEESDELSDDHFKNERKFNNRNTQDVFDHERDNILRDERRQNQRFKKYNHEPETFYNYNSKHMSDLNERNSAMKEKIQQSVEKIQKDISLLKNHMPVDDLLKPETIITLDQMQKDLDNLKIKQRDTLDVKSKALKIIEREVNKAKDEIRKEKDGEIDFLKEKHKNELKRKDYYTAELKEKYKENISKYKDMCIKKIKLERLDNCKKIEIVKNEYEERIEKYKSAYNKLKDKYKKDILKKYTNL